MPTNPDINRLDPEQYTGLVRAALHPDERKFFKEYLGQDSPDIKDYLLPQGRFAQARQVREDIVRATIGQMIPSQTNPMATLGEAQGLIPGFPVPPNARTYASAEGPGAPVSTGITPGQGMIPEHLGQPSNVVPGTMQDQYNALADQRSRPYFTEGPQPTTPVPGAGPPDQNALLPRSYQNLLIAKTHQAGLRPYAPGTMLRSDAMARYRDIMTGQAQEEFDGEAQKLESFLGMSTKVAPTGSDKARIDTATANIKEADAKTRSESNAAKLDQTYANTARTDAATKTDNTLRQARLDKLIAQAQLAQQNAKLAGDMKTSEVLRQKTLLFNLMKHGIAQGEISPEEQITLENKILSGTGLEATTEQPGMLRQFFGLPGNGVHIQPSTLPVPQGQPPSGNPMQFKPGDITPPEQGHLQAPEAIGNVQPTPEANMTDKEMAKALYDRMKEGDVQTFKGVKYRREGSKLVRVQ